MGFHLLKESISSSKRDFNDEEILLRADALFNAEKSQDLRGAIAQKIEELRHYDVLAMDRVVAILAWGRSGSILLASYLDGHEDVIGLPELCGWKLYEFFDRYQSLPLSDKLLAYPAYEPDYTRFFEGDFAISSVGYYAAVQSIVEFYRDWPLDFRESRKAFFIFLHIAYSLALGRRPVSSHPLIVYAEHLHDNVTAKHLVEDFPRAKFVHTIRDPITTCDRTFQHFLPFADRNIALPYSVLDSLVGDDRPQFGMESRTLAIRFEDLHSDTERTIRGLCNWLGLRHQVTLLESTFNGTPYVVTRDGKTWSGQRLDQAQRRSRQLSLKDRALLFALFYENFTEWGYPFPRLFVHRTIRFIVFISLFLLPMKMELVNARAAFERRILPTLRQGNVLTAIKFLFGIGFCRLEMISLLVPVFIRRGGCRTRLLKTDLSARRLGRPYDGTMRALTTET